MKERLRELRHALGLNQTEFGEKLGVTDGAISRLEKGSNNITDQMFLSICREFKVNADWLREGNGSMFIADTSVSVHEWLADKVLSPWELELLKLFLSIDPQARQAFLDNIAEIAERYHDDPNAEIQPL